MVQSTIAQWFRVPKDYTLERKEDYKKYDKDIIKCANWLEKTKYNEDDKNFTASINFMAEWVTGCTYINFIRNVRIDAVINECPKIRIYYMAGWARNALEAEGKTDKVSNCLAGLRCALAAYQTNKSFDRSKSIDDLIKIDNRGGLKDWVADRLD